MAIKQGSLDIIDDNGKLTNSPALVVRNWYGRETAIVSIEGSSPPAQGVVSGFVSGGQNDTSPNFQNMISAIQKFSLVSAGNATNVGSLSMAKKECMGYSSSTDGFTGGGSNNPNGGATDLDKRIQKFPFAIAAGPSTDVGFLLPLPNLSLRTSGSGHSSTTDGFTAGGKIPGTPGRITLIDKFPFSIASGTSASVGNLVAAVQSQAGHSSEVQGFKSGGLGNPATRISSIEKFPFTISSGTATDVGDLSSVKQSMHGQNSSTDGFTTGGFLSPPPTYLTIIDKFPFSITHGVASGVGNLASATSSFGSGISSQIDGFTTGGYSAVAGGRVTDIQKFPFAIAGGTAIDIGDLTTGINNMATHQD